MSVTLLNGRTPKPWQDVFFNVALAVAERSKDPSTQVGAVLVSPDNRILGTGFNGPPPQINDFVVPWNERPDKYDFIIHAEENAILTALDAHGLQACEDSRLYVTALPCPGCVLRAIRANVREIYCLPCEWKGADMEEIRLRNARLLDTVKGKTVYLTRVTK